MGEVLKNIVLKKVKFWFFKNLINIGENYIVFFWYVLINNNSNYNISDNVKYDINILYLCDVVYFN